jgi:hypothetical protein
MVELKKKHATDHVAKELLLSELYVFNLDVVLTAIRNVNIITSWNLTKKEKVLKRG